MKKIPNFCPGLYLLRNTNTGSSPGQHHMQIEKSPVFSNKVEICQKSPDVIFKCRLDVNIIVEV